MKAFFDISKIEYTNYAKFLNYLIAMKRDLDCCQEYKNKRWRKLNCKYYNLELNEVTRIYL